MAFVDRVSERRTALMALAIIFVVIYHYKCWVGGFPWYIGRILQFGYIGVDIFFFLSGFGLASSFQKNGIKRFYRNRAVKVLPAYLLYGVILFLNIGAKGAQITWLDILYKFSTIEYTFCHGGVDWFMSAIIQLYILFPLILLFVKKVRLSGVMATFIFVFAITVCHDFHWTHLAMLHRLPMFVMGVYCFVFRMETRNIKSLVLFSFVCFLALCIFSDSKYSFLRTSCLTPTLLYIVTSDRTEKFLNAITIIKHIGGATLQRIHYKFIMEPIWLC